MAKIVKAEIEETEEVEIEGGDADTLPDDAGELLKLQDKINKKLAKSKQDRITKMRSKWEAEAKSQGFTLQLVYFNGNTGEGKQFKVKYKDDKGNEWAGQGATPKWIVQSGKHPLEFVLPEHKEKQTERWKQAEAKENRGAVPSPKAA